MAWYSRWYLNWGLWEEDGKEEDSWGCAVLSHVQLFCSPMDCSQPGSSVHRIFQARILEWVVISYSRGIFLTQGLSACLLHCRRILYHRATWEDPHEDKWKNKVINKSWSQWRSVAGSQWSGIGEIENKIRGQRMSRFEGQVKNNSSLLLG